MKKLREVGVSLLALCLAVLLLTGAYPAAVYAADAGEDAAPQKLTLSNLMPSKRESTTEYTLGDVAVTRLAAYDVCAWTMRTPTEKAHQPMSRVEALKLLRRTFGKADEKYGTIPFTDVDPADAETVAWAWEHGIASGVSEHHFDGQADVSQEQFVAMLLHVMGYDGASAENALEVAGGIGLSPIGLSRDKFIFSDAALYLVTALKLPDRGGKLLRERSNVREANIRECPFPYAIRLEPASAEELEIQLKEAARYIPTCFRIFTSSGGLTQDDLFRVYQDYREDYYTIKDTGEGADRWYAPYIGRSYLLPTLMLSPYELGGGRCYLYLSTSYGEAWKLVCDRDDAFSCYEDSTVSEFAEAFYQYFVSGAESPREAVIRAENAMKDWVEYATPHTKSDGTLAYDDEALTVVGFVNGEAVCSGYADFFQYLMVRHGIPCVIVKGSTQSAANAGDYDHAWNKVSIDGKWLNVDVTWDDGEDTNRFQLKSDAYYVANRHWAGTYKSLK